MFLLESFDDQFGSMDGGGDPSPNEFEKSIEPFFIVISFERSGNIGSCERLYIAVSYKQGEILEPFARNALEVDYPVTL